VPVYFSALSVFRENLSQIEAIFGRDKTLSICFAAYCVFGIGIA